MSEDIKEAKQLLIENNLSYAGQLSFLAYTTRLEEENQQLKEVIEEVREVIKNEIPYLYEIDKEYEDVEGNTYFTYKEYDDSKLLQILDKARENK